MVNTSLSYSDEKGYEIIDGKVVLMSPSPNHNHMRALGNIHTIFNVFLKGKKCVPFVEFDVKLSKKDILKPDVMIVCDRSKIKSKYVDGAPDLVVEILSPSTAKRDKGYKKDLYEKSGVKEYWIVDVKSYLIEVYVLVSGKFVLDYVYHKYDEEYLEDMTDEEKSELVWQFKTTLYDDLTINVEDVFSDLL